MIEVQVESFFLLLFGAAAWLWLDSLKVREAAIAGARSICEADGLLLLDDTVAFSALKPVRDEDGRIKLQRRYEFEFSDTGDNRCKGSIVLLGRRVVLFNIGVRAALALRVQRESSPS